MKGLTLRPLAPGDVEAALAIQEDSPEAARWSVGDFVRVARCEFPGWVAESEGRVVGFIVARSVAEEIEILNIAVDPQARRTGVGSRLLKEAISLGAGAGARRVFLEVRESNGAARAFYERHGFSVCGHRRHYYSHPSEDALVLARGLP